MQCQASSARKGGLLVQRRHGPTPQCEVSGIDNSEGGHPHARVWARDQGAVAEPGEGAPAEDEVETFRVTQVTMVSLIVGAQKSPKTWMPDTSMVSGMQFAHVSKWDSAWVRLCTGKGLALHKNRVGNALAVRLWQEICSERARFTSQSFPLCKVC